MYLVDKDDIDPDELRMMLGLPSLEVEERIDAKLLECIEAIEARFNRSIKRPMIRYNLKGHTAGYAVPSTCTIRLNLEILCNPKHTEDMINQTLPHEVAHIAQFQLFPHSQAYGKEWRAIMHVLGIPANRCHNYETKAARKRTRKRFHYDCDCVEGVQVSTTVHNRIQAGTYTYRCRKCGGKLQ